MTFTSYLKEESEKNIIQEETLNTTEAFSACSAQGPVGCDVFQSVQGHTLFSVHVSRRSWLTLMVFPITDFSCACADWTRCSSESFSVQFSSQCWCTLQPLSHLTLSWLFICFFSGHKVTVFHLGSPPWGTVWTKITAFQDSVHWLPSSWESQSSLLGI